MEVNSEVRVGSCNLCIIYEHVYKIPFIRPYVRMIHSYQTSCTTPFGLASHRVVRPGPFKRIPMFVCLFVRSRICKIELSLLWVVPTH